MGDDELIKLASLYGARGVWNAAWDAAIKAIRKEADEADEFEERLYQIVLSMGFTGAGLGKRSAILQALTALSIRKSNDPALEGYPEGDKNA